MLANGTNPPKILPYFTMEGDVENYLNNSTVAMQKSLKIIFSDAIEKAASWEIESPRHEWLFNCTYPAQLFMTGSQIYWTDEILHLKSMKEDKKMQ